MSRVGPFKCNICHKEFLTPRALGSHTEAKHGDVWDRAGESGETVFVPVTPGGSLLVNLAATSEQEAIDNLLRDASHMPYDGWDSSDGMGFKQRGYEICKTVKSEED